MEIGNKNRYGFLLVFGLLLCLISSDFLTEGIFIDGLHYASISHNLAHGIGSFWAPSFSQTISPEFYAHLPLSFGLQSLFYSLFGDSFLIEKIYSFLTVIIVSLLIIAIWKEIGKEGKTAWIPLLLFVSIPTVSWAATSNLLENTMSIFILITVLLFLIGKKRDLTALFFFSGVTLLLAFLSKGITALFPFILPLLYWITKRESSFKKMLAETGLLSLGFLLPMLVIFMISVPARENVQHYFDLQVINSIQNVKTVPSHFYILYRFFLDIVPLLLIVLALLLYGWRAKALKNPGKETRSWFSLFFLLGLSGVLPVMISLKQSLFYILATYPFFAIAFALIIEPLIHTLTLTWSLKKQRVFMAIAVISLFTGLSLVINNAGKMSRDKELLTDIHAILPYIKEGSIVQVSPDLKSNYSLRGYLARYKKISLTTQENKEEFLLLKNKDQINAYDQTYEYMELNTETIFLLKKK